MNRTELADKLSKRTGLSKINADKLAVAFCDVVSTSMKASDRLVFSNFGTFHIVRYPEKTLHHPGTGKKMVIPPQNIIKWLPSEHLKKVIRGEERTDGNVVLHGSKKYRQDYEIKDQFTSEEYVIPIKIVRTRFNFEDEGSASEPVEISINVASAPSQSEKVQINTSDELPDAETLFFKNLAENFKNDEQSNSNESRNISATEVRISDASQKQEAVSELVSYMDQNRIPYENTTINSEKPIQLTPDLTVLPEKIETVAETKTVTDPSLYQADPINPEIINNNITLNIENGYLQAIQRARPSLWKQLFDHKDNLEFETRPKIRKKETQILPFLLHNQIAGKVILNKPDIWLDSKITDMLPYSLIQKHRVVPVGYKNHNLFVLMSDPFDYDAIFEIQRFVRNIVPVISSFEDIDKLINDIPIKENINIRKLPNDNLSPARLFDSILKRAIRLDAHTIEITSGEKDAFVTYKKHDVLKEYRMDEKIFLPLLSRIKKLTRSEKPSLSHFVASFDSSKHEFTASVLQTSNKEKINIKVLY